MAAWIWLEMAAWLHVCQLPGTWFVGRRLLAIPDELSSLRPLTRAVVLVLGAAVVWVLVSLGVLIAWHSGEVLHARFGRALCGFLGLFWFSRLAVQLWYFHALAWPRSRGGRVAHVLLTLIFGVQSIGYCAAWVLA